MSEQARQTKSPGMVKAVSVADYGDVGNDLWCWRAVGLEWRDGRQGGAIAGLPRRRNAFLSEPAFRQDCAPHIWRRYLRQFRRSVRACRMLLRPYQSA